MSLFSLYGIKEVADVTFWDATGAPVLYLDTLKVSTIEETAEQAEARGGKGNAPLIIWDYGKEITLTLEDALFSPKSLALMHGTDVEIEEDYTRNRVELKKIVSGTISPVVDKDAFVMYLHLKDENGKFAENATACNIEVTVGSNGEANYTITAGGDKSVTKEDIKEFTGEHEVYAIYAEQKKAEVISINADSFPGTYTITGDTYVRSTDGTDEFFQFIIQSAKINPEQTITMQADGDPSTFSMTVRVLRPRNGEMIKFVKYPKA